MKILTYILIVLMIALLGLGAFFYLKIHQPLAAEYAKLESGMPGFQKAKADLQKLQEKNNKETAWVKPVTDVVTAGLGDEISSGKAEVIPAGNTVIVNIAEQALYLPGSYTFSKDSVQLRLKLVGLLQKPELKGKEILIGNTTEGVEAQGRGRRKIRPKDARTLAAERSGVLVKDFEKNKVAADTLVAAAFTSNPPDSGIALKTHKTVIIISNPPQIPVSAAKPAVTTKPSVTAQQQPQSKPTATARPATPTPSPQQQPTPRAIPVRPAQPKSE